MVNLKRKWFVLVLILSLFLISLALVVDFSIYANPLDNCGNLFIQILNEECIAL